MVNVQRAKVAAGGTFFLAGLLAGFLILQSYGPQNGRPGPDNSNHWSAANVVLTDIESATIRGGDSAAYYCWPLANCSGSTFLPPTCNLACTGLQAGNACINAPAPTITAVYNPNQCQQFEGNENCSTQTLVNAACNYTVICQCQVNQFGFLTCVSICQANCTFMKTDISVCPYTVCP